MADLIQLVDGEVPVAASFNTNFTRLNTEVRPYNTGGTGQSTYAKGDLIYASNANALSRLTIGAIRGSVLAVSSTGIPTWGGPALYKSGEDITITNTVTETSLLNGASSPGPYSVAANTLGSTNRLRLHMIGKGTNTSGVSKTFTFKLKYGGTTLCTKALSVGNGLSNTPILMMADVLGDAATNAQLAQMTTVLTTSTYDQQVGTSAIDSTAAANLDVTMTLQTAATTITFVMQYVMVELVI